MAVPLPAPHRRKLPDERSSITRKFTLNGHRGYLTVGLFPDGRPGEIFVRLDKWGSTVRGMLDGWAVLFSTALQHGVPLEHLIEKFQGSRFEPEGATSDMGQVTSVFDFVCRYLERKFLR